jgi:hypothetical protein
MTIPHDDHPAQYRPALSGRSSRRIEGSRAGSSFGLDRFRQKYFPFVRMML